MRTPVRKTTKGGTARTLHITGDATADALLAADANALLIGMVLDQQDRLEKAFAGPAVLAERLGGSLDVTKIAEMPEEAFVTLCAGPPAIHRFPKAMAGRIQQVCRVLVAEHDGDAAGLWRDASSGVQIRDAIRGLPGFGEQKAKIFTALLGKQYGVTPPGWQQAAGEYGEPGFRSVADITDAESLDRVRETKRAVKAQAKAAAAKD